ncbi:MAG: hypothetical protein WCP29_05060 [Acidobacteriota bacterium]
MRAMLTPVFVLVSLVAMSTTPAYAAGAETFDATYRSAMASYYAVLAVSAHGNTEASLRQLILMRTKWEAVAKAAQPGGPEWTRDVAAGGQTPIAVVAAMLEDARMHVAAKDVAEAHAELEGIRVVLRDARARHASRNFDDALTDYHEAVERLESRIGLRNEIVLNADDYAAIKDHAARARTTWTEIDASAGAFKVQRGWAELAARTMAQLTRLEQAAANQDGTTAQATAITLKADYFALLAILARG